MRVGGNASDPSDGRPLERNPESLVHGVASLHAGITADAFERALRDHAAGVTVITADSATGTVGLTATSVVSMGAEPPILTFSLSALSSSTPRFLDAETIVVHLLADEDEDEDIARLRAAPGGDRFRDTTRRTSLAPESRCASASTRGCGAGSSIGWMPVAPHWWQRTRCRVQAASAQPRPRHWCATAGNGTDSAPSVLP